MGRHLEQIVVLMEEHGIPAIGKVPESAEPVFIPSACWRNIAPGILSTTRFTGMVLAGKEKLAVYDIGDGSMEWQVRAEGSLFYTKYGSYETKANGMILVCQDGKRNKTAKKASFVKRCGAGGGFFQMFVWSEINQPAGPVRPSSCGHSMSTCI